MPARKARYRDASSETLPCPGGMIQHCPGFSKPGCWRWRHRQQGPVRVRTCQGCGEPSYESARCTWGLQTAKAALPHCGQERQLLSRHRPAEKEPLGHIETDVLDSGQILSRLHAHRGRPRPKAVSHLNHGSAQSPCELVRGAARDELSADLDFGKWERLGVRGQDARLSAEMRILNFLSWAASCTS